MEDCFPSLPGVFVLAEYESISSSTVSSVTEVLQAQKKDRECCQAASLVVTPNSRLSVDELSILI